MVTRVATVTLCLTALVCAALATGAVAGGPPACAPNYCPPPTYAPAPCGPPAPRCGPPRPFPICGALLGGCANICGLAFRIPAMIMGGLLAPPPPLPPLFGGCGPAPSCAPPACAPPVCAPAPSPPFRRISKCKQYSANKPVRTRAYAVAPVQRVYPAPPSGFSPMFRADDTAMTFCSAMTERPFVLASGSLQAPWSSDATRTLAEKPADTNVTSFGRYW